MPLEAVSAVSQPQASAASTAPKQNLDSEVFLDLLVTQLTNQDPSSPMDTSQMISQTTELATMEQLTALATTSSEAFALDMRQAATALVGRQATYEGDEGQPVTGLVEKVSFAGAVPEVIIGGTAVPLDQISAVAPATSVPD